MIDKSIAEKAKDYGFQTGFACPLEETNKWVEHMMEGISKAERFHAWVIVMAVQNVQAYHMAEEVLKLEAKIDELKKKLQSDKTVVDEEEDFSDLNLEW